VHEECTVRRIESRARAKQGRRITRERKKGERVTEGRGEGGRERNEQPVTPRLARPVLDNRDVSRAKNRPGTPGPRPIRLQSSSALDSFALESRGHARVRASERVSEWRGRARGSERLRCARAIFRPRKRSAWVSAWIPRSFEAHAAPRRAVRDT